MALDSARSSADNCVRNNPGRCPTYQGGAATEARSATLDTKDHEPMDTVAFVPTLLQQLEAACAGKPLHNPKTDALLAERRAAYEAEQTRDLAGLNREQLAASVRRMFFQQSGEHVSTDFGVDLLIDDEGEIVNAAVGSVAEFIEHWGAPVTHARAEQIADEVRERSYRDELRESLERAVERAGEMARERAEEAYRMGNY
jgi:hypothetical protein